jgi:hypothetical protein
LSGQEPRRRSGSAAWPHIFLERATCALSVARSRYAEDQLARATATGTSQYVIFGAGLDTFAYRNPYADSDLLGLEDTPIVVDMVPRFSLYHGNKVSPFRRKKRERRRWRKAAKGIVSNVAQLEEVNPAVAATVRRIVKICTKIATLKRQKKTLKGSANI